MVKLFDCYFSIKLTFDGTLGCSKCGSVYITLFAGSLEPGEIGQAGGIQGF